jgi:hypothetical protein
VSGETFADVFVLAQGLRGRAPHGPPAPRVLDVLVFHRARARFLAAGAEPVAAGALPWPETGFEAQSAYAEEVDAPFDAGAVQAPHNGSFVVGTPAEVERREAADSPADVPARAGAAPPAPPAAEPPRETLRYRQPAVPAIARTAPVRTDGAPPAPVRPRPEETMSVPQPVAQDERQVPVEDTPARVAAAPEPPRDAYPFAAPAAPHPQTAASDVARAHNPPAADQRQQPSPPVPPAAPPVLVERRPAAPPERRDALPFVASPTRSAAAVAERVARTVSRRDEHAEAPPDEPLRPVRIAERVRESDALTPRSLLREVTRDEVVRALAERLRALARDDRFRLGELR